MSIAENIKALRTEHKLSQIEFGKIAGVTDKAVSSWENGEKIPRMGAIQKLADHFGISKSDIIEDVPNKSSTFEKVTDNQLKFALFGTTDIDDELLEDVKKIAQIQLELKKKKGMK